MWHSEEKWNIEKILTKRRYVAQLISDGVRTDNFSLLFRKHRSNIHNSLKHKSQHWLDVIKGSRLRHGQSWTTTKAEPRLKIKQRPKLIHIQSWNHNQSWTTTKLQHDQSWATSKTEPGKGVNRVEKTHKVNKGNMWHKYGIERSELASWKTEGRYINLTKDKNKIKTEK